MYGTDWMIEEEFEPIEPWTEFEAEWFESIRSAMKEVENGKRNVDSRSNQETKCSS